MQPQTLPQPFQEILATLARDGSVRATLPGGGVLSIDRGLPYLLVYRTRAGLKDDGTARLVSGEASYLLGGSDRSEDVSGLVRAIAEAGSTKFGAFMVLEVWAGAVSKPAVFVVRAPDGPAPETRQALVDGLCTMHDLSPGIGAEVRVELGDERHPPDVPPLLSIRDSWESGVLVLGLEVPPLHLDAVTGDVLPRFLRRFQQRLSQVLRQAVYEFIRVQTICKVASYRALGTRQVPDSIWASDRELAAIEHAFQFLLLVAPVNDHQAWGEFRTSGFERDPEFHYRLLPVDPDLLKRRLFAIPMEEIDDPALASLFQDKRRELDVHLTMLDERASPNFVHSSVRLYGSVDDSLLTSATNLLAHAYPSTVAKRDGAPINTVSAWEFEAAAGAEMAAYASREPAVASRTIQVRPDLVGLMVSEGNLLIGETLRLDPGRVQALLHHEVGTHVLTWVNGSAQPMQQLSLGLAGYDELQEGLAVLAEYLVGGLDRARMRLLAARVVATRAVEQGATFVESFRLLTKDYGFAPRSAWHVCTRVHQCGGFTRDLIYLRGLVGLLDYLRGGGELQPLYIGKIALRHLPLLEELRHRGVLRDPPLTPRFLEDPEALARLDAVRAGLTLSEMSCP